MYSQLPPRALHDLPRKNPDSRRMRWNQTFSETENRLLETCEREKRPNPYQSESPNQIQPEDLADTDSSSEHSSGSDETSESEEPGYGEHANDPDSVPRNQPNQGSNTLLGNRDYIIENRSWKDNFLLRDYLNLEQDAHWKIMTMQTMIQNKQNWTEIKQVLRE